MEYRSISSIFSTFLDQLEPAYVRIATGVISIVTPFVVVKLARKMSEFHPSHVKRMNAMAFTMYVLMILFTGIKVMDWFPHRAKLFRALSALVRVSGSMALIASYISLS